MDNLKNRTVNLKNNFCKYVREYKILYKFLNIYFLKIWIALIICFLATPIYSIGILYINHDYANIVLPSVTTSSLLFLPFWLLPTVVIDLKKNSIIEKFFVFSKKPLYANSVPFIYFYPIVLLSYFWNLLLLYFVSFDKKTFPINFFQYTDWGSMIFSAILAIFISLSIVSLFYTFFSNPIYSQIICYLLSMFCMFFSGYIIPLSVIINNSALNIISYFSPFRYINSLFTISMNMGVGINIINNIHNINIFSFGKQFEAIKYGLDQNNNVIEQGTLVLFKNYDLYLNIFVPILVSAACLSISLNTRMCKVK